MEIDEFMYSRKSFTESKLSYFHWTYLMIGFNSKRTDWQMVSEFIKYSKHDHHVHNYLGFFFAYFWICIDFNSANQCVAVNFNSITLNTLNYLARAHNQNMICAKNNLHKIFVVRFDVFNVGFSFIVMGRKRHKKTHFTTFLFFFLLPVFPEFWSHTSTHNCIRSIRSRRISRFLLLFLFFNSRWT